MFSLVFTDEKTIGQRERKRERVGERERKGGAEQDLAGKERKEKQKASLWVAMNSPAKEFPLLKALYISLCKPYHALRMS